MIKPLEINRIYDRNVNVDKMMMAYLNLCMHNHFKIEIFAPIGMLYNILLPINHYIGSIAISTMTKTVKNIGIPHGYFIRSLHHCISP